MTIPIGGFRIDCIRLILVMLSLPVVFLRTEFSRADEPSVPPPDGWWVYKTGELSEADRSCASSSIRARVVATSFKSWGLPSGYDRYPDINSVNTTTFAGGRFVGEDKGEWGGGLYWVSPDGNTKTKIIDDSPHALLRTSFGIFVLTGYDGVVPGSGVIWRLDLEGEPAPQATLIADLDAFPRAVDRAPDGSILIVTDNRLLRLAAPGTVTTLGSIDFDGLNPNSVAEMPDGVVYVGMRHFLARFNAAAPSSRVEWLLPTTCARFEMSGKSCECHAP